MNKRPDPTWLGFVPIRNLWLVSKEVSHSLVDLTCQASLFSRCNPQPTSVLPLEVLSHSCQPKANPGLAASSSPTALRFPGPHNLGLRAKAGAEAFSGWWSVSFLLYPVGKSLRRAAARPLPSGAPKHNFLGALLFVCCCLLSE